MIYMTQNWLANQKTKFCSIAGKCKNTNLHFISVFFGYKSLNFTISMCVSSFILNIYIYYIIVKSLDLQWSQIRTHINLDIHVLSWISYSLLAFQIVLLSLGVAIYILFSSQPHDSMTGMLVLSFYTTKRSGFFSWVWHKDFRGMGFSHGEKARRVGVAIWRST